MKNKGKLIITALGGLHCANEVIDHAAMKNTINSKGKFFSWDRGDIYYTISGKGEPILLVHDLNVFSSENDWMQVVGKLAKSYKVYTIDLPGCGKSDKPAVTYTNYMYVQMITEFIKVIMKEQTTVVASGLSSSFIIMANQLEEDLFKKIILINPPALSVLKEQPDEYSKVLIWLSAIPIIGRTLYYIATNRTNTEYYLSEKCFYNPFHMKQLQVKAAYKAAHTGKGKGRYLYASLKGKYLNTDITKALQNYQKEMTILLSDKETDANEVRAEYLKLNANIKMEVIHDAKKLPQMEMPDQICEIISKEMSRTTEDTRIDSENFEEKTG